MPPGAKKRKALKKKKQQQQEAIGTSTNNNGHGGNDDRESDSSNLSSSPGSQGNGGAKDPSPAMAKEISELTQGLGPEESGNGNAIIAVSRGTDEKKKNLVEKPPVVTSYENGTQTAAKNVASHHLSVKKIAPVVVDSVSKEVVSETSEHAEASSTNSSLVKHKSGETKQYPTTGLEKENGKVVATLPGSAAGTSKMVESVRESQVPLSPDEKQPLLLPGPPPAVRTSWLSCCGLFDAMTGSDR